MEEIKKQILLINIANYNETVNNMSEFKLNEREINLFCDIMQQFAEKYHKEQLMLGGVVWQSEQLLAFKEWERDKCRLPWDATPKEIIEQYLSQ